MEEMKKKRVYVSVMFFVLIVLIIVLGILIQRYTHSSSEYYCGTTGIEYGDVQELPALIQNESKSPPFYSISAPRGPLCAYMNYTMPPPLDVPPSICPDIDPRYTYWDTAMLSHPWTPYVI